MDKGGYVSFFITWDCPIDLIVFLKACYKISTLIIFFKHIVYIDSQKRDGPTFDDMVEAATDYAKCSMECRKEANECQAKQAVMECFPDYVECEAKCFDNDS